jgi:S1-C subfamily serine protease
MMKLAVYAAFSTAAMIFGGQSYFKPPDTTEILRRAEAATVVVKIPHEDGRAATCSGFFVNDRGDMLTANHCIDENTKAFTVTLQDGTIKAGKLVFTDASLDFTMAHIDGVEGNAFLPMGKSNHLKTGDKVFVVGTPFDVGVSVSSGIVSAPYRVFHDQVYVQTDAAINHGNSGGAAINERGEVIGMADAIVAPPVMFGTTTNDGVGLLIPSSMIKARFDDLNFLAPSRHKHLAPVVFPTPVL